MTKSKLIELVKSLKRGDILCRINFERENDFYLIKEIDLINILNDRSDYLKVKLINLSGNLIGYYSPIMFLYFQVFDDSTDLDLYRHHKIIKI